MTWRTLTPLCVMLSALVGSGPVSAQPPKLTAVVLGKEDSKVAVGEALAEGTYVLTGAGRDVPDNAEQGSFAGLETNEPNFTFTARIAKRPEGTKDPQFGLSIRAGLAGTEKAVTLRYDGRETRQTLGWFMRYHVTPSTHDGSNRSYQMGYEKEPPAEKDLWMKIERRYPNVFLYAGADGKSWREVGADYLKVLLPQKVWVGLKATAGGDGKTSVAVAFDNISFKVDPPGPRSETQSAYKEFNIPKPFRLYVAKGEAKGQRGPEKDFTALLMMPKGMDPRRIRAIVYSAGSKELTVGGEQLKWVKEGGLRRPTDMPGWEGVLDLNDVAPFHRFMEQADVVRVGGYFRPEHYEEAIRALARFSGIAHLPDIPFVVTGGSFAGGWSARAAELYPEKTIAAAPVVIGMAGDHTKDPRVLATPHLHVFGSRDGNHLGLATKAIPILREKHALWTPTPMWRVYHRQHKSNAIIYPYLLEVMRLRLPEETAAVKGPVPLKGLREEDGWLGLVDTWETNAPQVVPFKEYKGEPKNVVWLPSELMARLWQAFVSDNPKTIIHFPTFEGHESFGQPPPHGWHNSTLEANTPFEVVASGSLAKDVRVEYFSGVRRLKVIQGSNYRVTLEGLEPGLHAIYAVTTLDGQREVSRPVTILFQARQSK